MTNENSLYRIAIFANPDSGCASFSWRVRAALENLGHSVFWFDPILHPFLFSDGLQGQLLFDVEACENFINSQKIDLAILCDRITVNNKLFLDSICNCIFAEAIESMAGVEGAKSAGAAAPLFGTEAPAVATESAEAAGAKASAVGATAHAVATKATETACILRVCGSPDTNIKLGFMPDNAYAQASIGNPIQFLPGIMCVQDASAQRIDMLNKVIELQGHLSAGEIRCFGNSWPSGAFPGHCEGPKQNSPFASLLTHAARFSKICVVFPGDDAPSDFRIAQLLTDGCTPVYLSDTCKQQPARLPAPELAKYCKVAHNEHEIVEIFNSLPTPKPSRHSIPIIPMQTFNEENLRLKLKTALKLIKDHANPQQMTGFTGKRCWVSALGYLGHNNFGDELIACMISDNLGASFEGASIIAISDIPEYTFKQRGLYSIHLKNREYLLHYLRLSAASLVFAGPLFDWGVYWTAGISEVFDSKRLSVGGIAGFALMSEMCDCPCWGYGIGAGPLDVEDGRKLVSLAGKSGMNFIARDAGTATLIGECGVPNNQIYTCADSAFLYESKKSEKVQAWLGAEGINSETHTLCVISMRELEYAAKDYINSIVETLNFMCENIPNFHGVIATLDSSDTKLAERINAEVSRPSKFHIYKDSSDIQAMAHLIQICDMGFAMRYHCCLLLANANKPCLGVGYLPKTTSLFKDLGVSDCLIHVQATREDMLNTAAEFIKNQKDIVSRLAQGAEKLRRLSEEAQGILHNNISQNIASKCKFSAETFMYEYQIPDEIEITHLHNRLARAYEEHAALTQENESLKEQLKALNNSKTMRLNRKINSIIGRG